MSLSLLAIINYFNILLIDREKTILIIKLN
jgi:hypothetical protein